MRLFFIPPLSSIASIFASGEYFHPRTTAATLNKDRLYAIEGLKEKDLQDPLGIIVITQDPFRHAELFSQFLAQNGQVIQAGDESQLTPEEKTFVDRIMQSQKDIAQLYKASRFTRTRMGVAQKRRQRKFWLISQELPFHDATPQTTKKG